MVVNLGEFRERRFAAFDDVSIYFRDYGDANAAATPVVCLAGLARNSHDFHSVAARLGRHRRVLCMDYRGRGRSADARDHHSYRLETYVFDTLHLLAVTDVHRAVVIGTSLGGLVALGLAAARPAALAGVVLNDIGPEIDAAGLKRIADYVGASTRYADREQAVAALRDHFGAAFPGLSDERWRDFARGTFRQQSDGTLRPDYDPAIVRSLKAASAAPPDLWRQFTALRHIPTLAMRGAHSDILGAATFDKMAAMKPDLVRVTVPERGHAPLLDEPAAVTALDAFFADR